MQKKKQNTELNKPKNYENEILNDLNIVVDN